MVKVVKLYLSPTFRHRDDTDIEYKDVCIILRELQREVREIKNKTVTDCWEWKGFSADYKKQHDEYPQPIDFLKSKKGTFTVNTLMMVIGFVKEATVRL